VKRLAIALIVAALAACGGGAPPPSSASTLLGKAAPAFRRDALDGTSVDLAGARGKVVVVKFVAKYCEPCARSLPAIERLHAAHPEIMIVGVAEDEHEADARALVSTFNLSFQVVHDRENVLAARYRVRDLPVTYVLDGRGSIAWVGGPEKTEDELVRAIEATRP
jgi:cytochrome c biogenesis protein CcmG, thiol:disulfide interchange protein DsbE